MKNLLTAGRCISTDEEAFGSLRVMPPCLVTGEAAGMAAVHAIKLGIPDNPTGAGWAAADNYGKNLVDMITKLKSM